MFSKKQKVLFQSEVAYSIVGGLEQALAWKKVIQDKEPCSCSCSRLTALKAGLFYFNSSARIYFTMMINDQVTDGNGRLELPNDLPLSD